MFLRVPKIVLGLPSFSIITAPIDQIFVGIRKVRSLALYAFNDPFFCTSLPLRSQRLSTMELSILIAHHATRIQIQIQIQIQNSMEI